MIGTVALAVIVAIIISFNPGRPASKPKVAAPPAGTPVVSNGSDSAFTSTVGKDPGTGTPTVTPPPPDATEGGDVRGLPVTVNLPKSTPPATTPAPTSPAATSPGAITPPAPQVPPFQPRLTGGGTLNPDDFAARTAALKTALEHLLKKSVIPATLTDLHLDPRTNVLTMDFVIPRMSTATEAKQALLYTGFHLIWTAGEQDKLLAGYTLRGAAALPGEEEVSLAFMADVTPQQAESARGARDYQTVVTFLGNPYWRKELASASLATSAGR